MLTVWLWRKDMTASVHNGEGNGLTADFDVTN